MYILLLWTELGSSGVLDCTVDHRLLFFHVQNIAGWPYQKKKPKSFTTLLNGIDFFLPFSGALLVLTVVLCPQNGSLGPLHATYSLVSAFPHHSSSFSWPLAGVSLTWRRGLFMLCHGHAGPVLLCFTCRVYQGMLQSLRWQGQLYCLVSQGRAAPLLLLCWWLWVLLWARSLWERTVLNLQPLLTEDDEPTFGTSPPLATQQVTLKQRRSLWTLGKL